MYLSRFELNVARRGARYLIGSPQKLHAAVEASFSSGPQSTQGAGSRRLWRLDTGNPNPRLYVVSETAPDFTHLEEQAGWPTQPNWTVAEYSPLLDNLSADQLWDFRLTANPVHAVRTEGGGRSKRLAHVTVAQQEAWLAQRSEHLGVSFDVGVPGSSDGEAQAPRSFRVEERRLMKFKRKNNSVTIRKVRYDGVLRVTDPERLRNSLTNGIGPAKAYGCGLLTLVPATVGGESRFLSKSEHQ